MKALDEPWIAFKVLAAGAIRAEGGLPATPSKAARISSASGMYDFQIVEDVNLALDVLNGGLQRQRPWRA